MIFESVSLMIIIDFIIIVVVLFALWNFYQHRQLLKQLQSFKSLALVFSGMILIAAFYLSDLMAMLVAPIFMTKMNAMKLMEYLHLNVSWIINLIVVGLIVVGTFHLNRILQGVGQVTGAAAAVEAGQFEAEMLADVVKRPDEVGKLGRVFQHMARTVYVREERLRQQIHELQIGIDEAKKERQVAEITDTEYFQELRKKANELRKRTEGSDK